MAHQFEHLTNLRQRRGEHGKEPLGLSGLEQTATSLKSLAHNGQCDAVNLVARRQCVETIAVLSRGRKMLRGGVGREVR